MRLIPFTKFLDGLSEIKDAMRRTKVASVVDFPSSHRDVRRPTDGSCNHWYASRDYPPRCIGAEQEQLTCAIVYACSRVASRNGAAGNKLMRSSHATWTSTLNPPTTSIRGKRRRQQPRHRLFCRCSIARCSISQGQARWAALLRRP